MKQPSKRSRNDCDDAWAAGFFDGEGTIGLYTRQERWTRYCVRACAAQTQTSKPLKLLKRLYGGGISGPNKRGAHVWVLTGAKLRPFIESILPFCTVKGPQLTVALRALEIQASREYPWQPYSEAQRRQLEEIEQLLKELKR